MSSYRVQVRFNLRPDFAVEFVETLQLLLPNTGLRLRSGVPGLVEGDDLSSLQLNAVLDFVNKLRRDATTADQLEKAGLLDDLWIHVSRR